MLQVTSRQVNGTQVAVTEGGNGPLLLYLHAGSTLADRGGPMLDQLAKSYTVVAPIIPGFGTEDRPAHIRTVGDLSLLFLDLLDDLDAREATVVGAALGGWIVAEMAIRSTERIANLALISPFGIKAGDREARDFEDFFLLEPADRAKLEFESRESQQVDFSTLTDEQLAMVARGQASEAHFGWEPFMHNPTLRHWLHRIGVPTVVVRGASNRVIAAHNHQAFADRIPHATLAEITGAGHYVHIEKPDEVAHQIVALGAVPA